MLDSVHVSCLHTQQSINSSVWYYCVMEAVMLRSRNKEDTSLQSALLEQQCFNRFVMREEQTAGEDTHLVK